MSKIPLSCREKFKVFRLHTVAVMYCFQLAPNWFAWPVYIVESIYRGAIECFPVFSAWALADFLFCFSRIIYNNILFWLRYYSVLEGRFLYRTHKMLKYHENVNMCTKHIWKKLNLCVHSDPIVIKKQF